MYHAAEARLRVLSKIDDGVLRSILIVALVLSSFMWVIKWTPAGAAAFLTPRPRQKRYLILDFEHQQPRQESIATRPDQRHKYKINISIVLANAFMAHDISRSNTSARAEEPAV